MLYYIGSVAAIVVLSSIALGYVLNKNKLLNLQIIVAIGLSSIIVSIMFPFTYSIILSLEGFRTEGAQALLAFVLTLIFYITLTFLLSIIISIFITDELSKQVSQGIRNAAIVKAFINIPAKIKAGLESRKQLSEQPEENKEDSGTWEAGQTSNLQEDIVQGKNILEKSVDTEQNTDKMGVENFIEKSQEIRTYVEEEAEKTSSDAYIVAEEGETADGCNIETGVEENKDSIADYVQEIDEGLAVDEAIAAIKGADEQESVKAAFESNNTSEDVNDSFNDIEAVDSLNVEECVDRAFKMKEAGDLEGAIAFYMYALDKNPDSALVFWVVLDMCVLYKSLGQTQFAKEILEGYISSYGDIMDESVKAEIERNLS